MTVKQGDIMNRLDVDEGTRHQWFSLGNDRLGNHGCGKGSIQSGEVLRFEELSKLKGGVFLGLDHDVAIIISPVEDNAIKIWFTIETDNSEVASQDLYWVVWGIRKEAV